MGTPAPAALIAGETKRETKAGDLFFVRFLAGQMLSTINGRMACV